MVLMIRDLLQLGVGNAITAVVLAAVALVLTRIWRRPAVAWCLWTLVLVRLAAPPLVALPVQVDRAAEEDVRRPSQVTVTAQSLASAYGAAGARRENFAGEIEPSSLSRGVEVSAQPGLVAQPGDWLPLLESLAFIVWAGGAIVLAAVIARRAIGFHRLVLRTSQADLALQDLANQCARRLKLRHSPEVRIVPGHITPLVWALGRRARVLLPAGLLERLNEPQATALLMHELAHLRRRDPWMRWFEAAAVVLHWWNPIAWWARARLQQAEEECCDALVLQTLPNHASAYAEALLETVQFLSEGRAASPMLASGFGRVNHLKRRFEMILQGSRRRVSWPGRIALLVVMTAVVPFSAYAVWGEEGEAPPTFVERLERLEKLVEKLLEREENAVVGEASASRDKETADLRATQARDQSDHPRDGDRTRTDSLGGEYGVQSSYRNRLAEHSDARRRWLQEQGRRLSPTEIKIQEVLSQPVEVRFNNEPLSDVVDKLSAAVGVNFRLNPEGLRAEGVTSDIPVNLRLRDPVSLRSALNLILEPLHLSYAIRNEVLEITSEEVRRAEVVPRVYNVGDLVIPIPAAVMGESGAPEDFTAWALWSRQQAFPKPAANVPPTGPQPDFDTLIETITSTVAPESWDKVGGPGAIHPHAGNLSLVITQTQEVHARIAELLEQMRRLQDVQIALETRFLEVPEDFLKGFDNLGVDFSFAVREIPTAVEDEHGAAPIGIDMGMVESKPIQVSAVLKEKQLLLDDREMRIVMEAAQAHARTNIIAAPKVTLFNGQRAFVQFAHAAAREDERGPLAKALGRAQPAIRNQTISLGVQGVVSADRRSVRLSASPMASVVDAPAPASDPSAAESAKAPAVIAANPPTSVTVNVPDGGTVLMDGGVVSAAARKRPAKRLLVLVTPRILVAEEEEEKLGIDKIDHALPPLR
jgi:beta-lactamase regulating signal transducer with metallopeptidase domain